MLGAFANSQYIGEIVDVKIERPFGSKHPEYGFEYPVNYGFIPNTITKDAEELEEAIESFTGFVIVMIHRLNDFDDKLIVVPDGQIFADEQIRDITKFQEQYFQSVILRIPL